MITTQELMIGSLLFSKHHKGIAEVVGILRGNIYINLNPLAIYSPEDFEPIPLTSKILLKCGFTEAKYSVGQFMLGNIGILEDDDHFDIGCERYESYSDSYVYDNIYPEQSPIKYLHHLQALIFSLTGTPLNIEL